jgi:hypothetical protein
MHIKPGGSSRTLIHLASNALVRHVDARCHPTSAWRYTSMAKYNAFSDVSKQNLQAAASQCHALVRWVARP